MAEGAAVAVEMRRAMPHSRQKRPLRRAKSVDNRGTPADTAADTEPQVAVVTLQAALAIAAVKMDPYFVYETKSQEIKKLQPAAEFI